MFIQANESFVATKIHLPDIGIVRRHMFLANRIEEAWNLSSKVGRLSSKVGGWSLRLEIELWARRLSSKVGRSSSKVGRSSFYARDKALRHAGWALRKASWVLRQEGRDLRQKVELYGRQKLNSEVGIGSSSKHTRSSLLGNFTIFLKENLTRGDQDYDLMFDLMYYWLE